MTAQKQNANYDQFKKFLSIGVNTFKEPSTNIKKHKSDMLVIFICYFQKIQTKITLSKIYVFDKTMGLLFGFPQVINNILVTDLIFIISIKVIYDIQQ